ncbi:MAG: hypothetical protein AAFY26_11745 [Cyanobacteria bacterium J06638_22]
MNYMEFALALVPATAGLLPIIFEILDDRTRHNLHSRELKRLHAELELLEKWQTLFAGLDYGEPDDKTMVIRDRYREQLERVLERFRLLEEEKQTQRQVKSAKTVQQLSLRERAFLLFTPRSLWGWAWHTMFYCLLLFVGAVSVLVITNPLYAAPELTLTLTEMLVMFLFELIVFGLPLFFLHQAALGDYKKRSPFPQSVF